MLNVATAWSLKLWSFSLSFNPCSIIQGQGDWKVNLEKAYFKVYGSFQMASDVACLETYHIKITLVLKIITQKYER